MKKKAKKKDKKFSFFKKKKSNRFLNIFKKKETFNSLEVTIIILLSFIIGFVLALIFVFAKDRYLDKSDEPLNEIINTYNSILEEYYDKVNPEDLSKAAVSGMVNSLDDPYSYYMDKETSDDFNESLEGTYEGIGLVITRYDQDVEVVKVVKNSPASKAGFIKGDILVKINDTDVYDLTVSQIAEKIKNTDDINITYRRGEEEKTVSLKKETLETQSVNDRVIDGNIGYIQITTFSSNASKQFGKSLKRLEKKGIKSLIIDVRGNPGGHLEQADYILSHFFKKGTVLYKLEEKKGMTKVLDKTREYREYPVVILVSEYSASASEIVASAFQEQYKKAKIVGLQTFGKGTIQNEVLLKNGGSYKYTLKKWLTSKGVWYDRETTGGLKPDVEQVLNDTLSNDSNIDSQLEKAKEILKEEM